MLLLSVNLPAQAMPMAAVLPETICNAAVLHLLAYVHGAVQLTSAELIALTPYFNLAGMMMSGEITVWWWETT